MGSNNLAGSLIFIFEKSPWGQLNCRVANFFVRLSPMELVIRPGQLIGSEEYIGSMVLAFVFVNNLPDKILFLNSRYWKRFDK